MSSMNPVFAVLLAGLALSLLFFLCVLAIRAGDRDKRLEEVAGKLRMSFGRDLPPDLKGDVRAFFPIRDAFHRGGDVRGSIRGVRRGRAVAFFDYQDIHYAGQSRRRHSFFPTESRPVYRTSIHSAVAAELGFLAPGLLIRPEGLLDKIAGMTGFDKVDIDLPSLPEFSRRFQMESPDPAFAALLVTPLLAQFMLERVQCHVEFADRWVLLYENRGVTPSKIPAMIELASALADLATREIARHQAGA